MSKLEINSTWTKDLRESVREATKEKRSDSSRENSNSRKRVKPNEKTDIDIKQSKPQKKPHELETDLMILQRRQKQIDYGKNTVGYHNYLQQVPKQKRTKEDPRTPDKYSKYSRRSWDTLMKMWRKKLHEYDSSANAGSDADSNNKEEGEDEDEGASE